MNVPSTTELDTYKWLNMFHYKGKICKIVCKKTTVRAGEMALWMKVPAAEPYPWLHPWNPHGRRAEYTHTYTNIKPQGKQPQQKWTSKMLHN